MHIYPKAKKWPPTFNEKSLTVTNVSSFTWHVCGASALWMDSNEIFDEFKAQMERSAIEAQGIKYNNNFLFFFYHPVKVMKIFSKQSETVSSIKLIFCFCNCLAADIEGSSSLLCIY